MAGALEGKRVLVGVSGGIAIYKTLTLLSLLNKAGAHTEVIMTKNATNFVSDMTFATMSKHPVHTDLLAVGDHDIPHIDLTKKHDVFVIAPATANVIAKMRNGIADDLLSATALASSCPILIAPAMNTVMYHNVATQENISVLRSRGVGIIEPGSGMLACNVVGDGRMEEPEVLLQHIESALTKKDLSGKRILVTAGPTKERIDPVRYLTNDSSGKMGIAIATRALLRGADVTVIHGDVQVDIPKQIEAISIQSTQDLLHAIEARFDEADALIMAAAPADYRPKETATQKIKKRQEDGELVLELVETEDVLKEISRRKDHQIVIGFAAETENLIDNALGKLERKGLDYIVANDVSMPGAGFNVDTNIATILGREKRWDYEKMSKLELADHILDRLLDDRQ